MMQQGQKKPSLRANGQTSSGKIHSSSISMKKICRGNRIPSSEWSGTKRAKPFPSSRSTHSFYSIWNGDSFWLPIESLTATSHGKYSRSIPMNWNRHTLRDFVTSMDTICIVSCNTVKLMIVFGVAATKNSRQKTATLYSCIINKIVKMYYCDYLVEVDTLRNPSLV